MGYWFLTGKSIELVKSLHRRRISITYLQETKWVGAKVREIDRYKLWYSGSSKARKGVGILVENELVDFVVEMRRKSDRVMAIKVVVGLVVLNVISVYASHIGLPEEIKKQFWEDADLVIQDVPRSENLSSEETLVVILVPKQMAMIQLTEVSGLGRETMEEFLFWTSQLPLRC